ncbi:post-transcriptional regulator [Jeotgalibacillus sp. R-1-5s-1]|uniref:post-transcriptional regulator n=1 Tax=Jeotgalibacillus sp. R-1-5s-1 TaxID=2555897 RepID=UPI00141B6D3C|nr:post-transcriptional regulator [Jeotgalibacillus sp. R-1-5s-1]
MNKEMSFEEAFKVAGPALVSKAQELQLYGYDSATPELLWKYIQTKKWKREQGEIRIHRAINDILTIKAGDFMNFMANQEYRSFSVGNGLNDDEVELLLYGEQNGNLNKS